MNDHVHDFRALSFLTRQFKNAPMFVQAETVDVSVCECGAMRVVAVLPATAVEQALAKPGRSLPFGKGRRR